ncbi:MAG: ATP synthase F1 subunit delta [Alphaproteobacteria bacterium]
MASHRKVSERYAKALFDAAFDIKCTDNVAGDFEVLKTALQGSDNDFYQALSNRTISLDAIAGILSDIADKAKMHDVSKRFLQIIAYARRAEILPTLCDAVLARIADHKNQMTATVRSAYPATKDQEAKIIKLVESKTGKDIVMEHSIDKDLIGGMVIQYGSYRLDFSLKAKLNELKLELEGLN